MGETALIDVDAVTDWVGGRLPGAGRWQATRIGEGSGMANALFVLDRSGQRVVLRRPPPVKNDPSASDVSREWRILRALEGTPVPHPTPLLLCEDEGVIGAPFLLMTHVDGYTPGTELPRHLAEDPAYRAGLSAAYVDAAAELSMVDWAGRGLVGLGKPDGFLERQVGRWSAQLERYRTRALPGIEDVAAWLEANRPPMSAAGLLHGDYSPFNVMAAWDRPARLVAVVDWDTGTIGDPLLDIGHLLARWTEPGEEPILPSRLGAPGPGTAAAGIPQPAQAADPTRREMARRYAERTGRDVGAISYYAVLALFKLAVILEGTYARVAATGTPDAGNPMAEVVVRLVAGAGEFACGRRTI